jgi:SAM-dependent methyltransferase
VFLASQEALIHPGMRALAVADGEGRNGVWLAAQGARVHAVDFSPAALDKARKLADERGVTLEAEQADILNWNWPEAEYDLVVAIFIQFAPPPERERIVAGIRRCLKPGGLLILQGYTPKQIEFATGGPSNPANLYTADLLRGWFGDWDIVHLHEHESFIGEGSHHHGMSALIDLVARKPR